MPARSADDVRIETYSGLRVNLRRLFEVAGVTQQVAAWPVPAWLSRLTVPFRLSENVARAFGPASAMTRWPNGSKETTRADPRYDDLSALFFNCTLKPSPQLSNTQGLIDLGTQPGEPRAQPCYAGGATGQDPPR